MSKIVIDARALSGSTGRYMRELLKGLEVADKDTEYTVVVNPSDESSWEPSQPNFKRISVKYKPYRSSEQLGFAWFLYRQKADLVHFTMPQQPILYLRRRVTTVHDLTLVHFKNLDINPAIYFIRQTFFKLMLWLTAHHAKHLITPSQYSKKDLMRFTGVKDSKVTVTYEAAAELNPKQKDEPIDELNGQSFIMYVGNAFPYKNLKHLTEAMRILKETTPNLKLALAGKPDFFYEQLEAHIKSEGLDNVELLGFVSDAQLEWMYKNAQAYVFPSLSEGFGLPGLEAMQHSLPVVSSHATCLPEVYGEAAHYFDPTNVADTANSIREVLEDTTLRDRLIKNGKKQLSKYSWSKMVKETLEVYKQALS